MQIRRTTQLNNTQPLSFRKQPKTSTAQASTAAPMDQLDLSVEAQMLSQTGNIRQERVAHLKSQIAAGVYETPEKIDAAVDRMLDEYA